MPFELEHDSEIIAARTGIHYEQVQEIMGYMVESGLFEKERGVITCQKMATRTDEYTQKLLKNQESELMDQSGFASAPGTVKDNVRTKKDFVRTVSGDSPDKVPPIRIEENRREKKRGDKKRVDEKKSLPVIL